MLETVNDFGRKVTALYQAGHYCSFAPPEKTLGVLDTSADHNGARGIAFLCDELRTCFDGSIHRVYYNQIRSVNIIRSYETTFDDELELDTSVGCIRITDCSLNKFFLRQLISSLCRLYAAMSEEERTALCDNASQAALEHFAGELPTIEDVPLPEEVPAAEEIPQPQHIPAEIPDEAIDWVSAAPQEPPAQAAEEDFSHSDLPEDMSREEAMAYLLNSISEINSDEESPATEKPAPNTEQTAPAAEQAVQEISPAAAGLTAEPDSDDIYIKASRRLREFCMEGSLTMEQMQAAVKENLLPTAEAYSAITAENEIPEIIAKRAEKLKSATEHLADYFAMGEDIAARVMFFMLYQMLSYSDRICEREETKENINDFFRRYGPAGLALSLIDSGI